MLDKLAAIEAKYSQIEARLAAPETYDDPAQVAKLNKEQNELAPVVETYRQPVPGEVVERYSRPLPGRPAAPGQPRRRRRTGLWIFLACLAVVLGVAAGSWIWYLLPAGSSADPFEYRYDHGWEEEEDASGAVTIPTYPFGEGAVLEVETDQSPRRESRPM